MNRFNAIDILDWEAYEDVRQSGRFNMFDPRARRTSGLSRERYLFVLKNYSEIKAEIDARVASLLKTADQPTPDPCPLPSLDYPAGSQVNIDRANEVARLLK